MAKKKVKPWLRIKPDPVYNSVIITKFINRLMKDGKKTTAMKVFYDAMGIIEEKMGMNPLDVFNKAIENVKPKLEVRTRRIGGANYQIPVEVRPERRLSLAIRWIITSAQEKKGKPMAQRLAEELMAAYRNEGAAVKIKQNVHRMAEANRAFAHFKW